MTAYKAQLMGTGAQLSPGLELERNGQQRAAQSLGSTTRGSAPGKGLYSFLWQ